MRDREREKGRKKERKTARERKRGISGNLDPLLTTVQYERAI